MDNFINPKDLLYPIGSVYISKYNGLDNCSAHDPSQIFGGTWEEIYYHECQSYFIADNNEPLAGLLRAQAGTDYYYLDNSIQYYNFYNENANTNRGTKVRYYLRVA